MKPNIYILAGALFGIASAVYADGVINGDFEDTSPEHHEWIAYGCDFESTISVQPDPASVCSSFAELKVSSESSRLVRIEQGGLTFCSQRGDFATFQFDARTYRKKSVSYVSVDHEDIAPLDLRIPFTNGLWEQFRVSIPITDDMDDEDFTIKFTAQTATQNCIPNLGELDIDNVLCFESTSDLTTLCDSITDCLGDLCSDQPGPLQGAGLGCPPVYPPCFSDLNGDCKVDGEDLAIVSLGIEQGCDPEICENHCYGDANRDGVVDFRDIIEVASNFGECSYGPCVPAGCIE